MDITLNLASEPYIDARPVIRGLRISIVAITVSIIVAGSSSFFVHQKARDSFRQQHDFETTARSLQGEQRTYQDIMRSSVAIDTARQADELNQIFDAKAFSWTAVMQDLERVLPTNVQVTAIEPTRTKEGATYLHLRVIGPHERSIDLLRNLEDSKRFVRARIVGESLANSAGSAQKSIAVDASTMMEFDLMTEYDDSATDDVTPYTNGKGKRSPQAVERPKSSPAVTTHIASANLREQTALNRGAR